MGAGGAQRRYCSRAVGPPSQCASLIPGSATCARETSAALGRRGRPEVHAGGRVSLLSLGGSDLSELNRTVGNRVRRRSPRGPTSVS